MYTTDPNRTAVCQYTPRQWVRLLLDERVPMVTQHLISYVILELSLSDHYPEDAIAASATPREASVIAAIFRDYEQRGY